MAEMNSFIEALDYILNHVSAADIERPVATSLDGNYPNPFNSSTKISYSVASPGPVLIQIFNIQGQLVKTVVDDYKSSGIYTFIWDGTNGRGAPAVSGSYFYRMTTRDFNQVRRMILVK
jgi:flagellar hook assembly protein FlgD